MWLRTGKYKLVMTLLFVYVLAAQTVDNVGCLYTKHCHVSVRTLLCVILVYYVDLHGPLTAVTRDCRLPCCHRCTVTLWSHANLDTLYRSVTQQTLQQPNDYK